MHVSGSSRSSLCKCAFVLQAVEKFTGVTLHDNQTLQYLTASHLDVISEGDEEGHDSDGEPGGHLSAPEFYGPACL